MKPLFLTLKRQWFDMTRDGEKLEEYRELKPYWATRLLEKIDVPWGGFLWAWPDILDGDYTFTKWDKFSHGVKPFRQFSHAYIRLGYNSDAPQIIRSVSEIVIATGRPEWGAEPGKYYFVIRYKSSG